MKIIKKLSLLLAGSLIGISAALFEVEISKHLLWIVVLILLLILVGVGLLDWIRTFYLYCVFFINKKTKRIGLFASYEVRSDNSSWVNVSLNQILNELTKSKVKFGIITKDKNFEKYPIVVNPYGGVYPETNLSSLKTLNNIFSYVREGGIYINIADIPFYYAYDENLKRRIDTTPLAGDFSQVRSFLQTILTKKLHCFVYGLVSGEDFKDGIERIIELPGNAHNFFHKEITINGSDKKFSPFLAIPYGCGYFVFSTIAIDETKIDHISEIIKKSLELLV